jgi:hypothetical protein
MTTTSCASCNATTTKSNPLKLCGGCKTVSYCNQACQNANWQAHKLACSQSKTAGAKAAKKESTKQEIASNTAALEESLLEDGQLRLGEIMTIPHDSYTFKMMPPTPELPRGYQKMVYFPPWCLASISHLPVGEQENPKDDYANQMDAAIESQMTPE